MPQAPLPTRRSHLGDILVDEGKLSREELDAALAFRESRGMKLGQALVALHLVTQQDLARALRSQGKVACLHLTPGIVDPQVARLLPREMARQFVALPVHRVAGRVTVAMEDPSETYDVDAIAVALGEPIHPVHAEPERILEAIEQVYGTATPAPLAATNAGEDAPARFTILPSSEPSPTSHADVAELLDTTLRDAVRLGATAVHVDATAQGAEVSLRVGGRRARTAVLGAGWAPALCDEIARRTGVSHEDGADARHGTADVEIGGARLAIEVALVAALHGPSAVVRLARSGPPATLADLGFDAREVEQVRRWSARGGIVLLAGPEDAAPMETARAILDDLAQSGRRTAAIAHGDLGLASCVARRAGRGAPAAAAVASLLELCPDVLYVDEIAGPECAGLLARAALERVLVLARIPADDGAQAARRLLALGVAPLLAAEVLRGTIACAAVRGACARCAAGVEREGCAECEQERRIPVHETLEWDGALAEALAAGANKASLREIVRAQGSDTLRERAEALVRSGATTQAAVERALGV